MSALLLIERGHRRRCSTLCGHTEQTTKKLRSEYDHIVSIPCTAAASGSVAESLYRSARYIGLPQFSIREKPKDMAVGRPKRETGALGSRQCAGLERSQISHPQTG